MIKHFLIDFLLFFLTLTVSGSDYRIVRYNTNNGLSNNIVYDIVQDKDGFLWIATGDGLCRYDGYKFLIFKSSPGEQYHIGESVLNNLMVDKKSSLWVGAEYIHQYNRDREQFKEYIKPFDGKIQNICEIRSGVFLLQCAEPYGLWLFLPKEKKFIGIKDFLPEEFLQMNIIAASVDNKGNVWLSSYSDNSLYVFSLQENNKFVLSNKFSNMPAVISFCESAGGVMYFGSNAGDIYKLKGNEMVRVVNINPLLKNNRTIIKSLIAEDENNLWIGTDVGLYRINLVTLKPENIDLFDEPNAFQSNVINKLLIDDFSQLWVATSYGLYKINLWHHPILQFQSAKNGGLPDNQINNIYKDEQGTVWVATGKGLAGIDVKNNIVKKYSNQPYSSPLLLNDIIFTIAGAGEKGILLGSVGINQVDLSKQSFGYVFPNPDDSAGLRSFVIWKIHYGQHSGHYWIATIDGLDEMIYTGDQSRQGMYRMPVTFKHHSRSPGNSMPCNNIWDVYEDKTGRVWMASSCGLTVYDPAKNNYTSYHCDPNDPFSLSSKSVKCILLDSKNRVWLGTEGGGVNQFIESGKKFIRYRQKDGLPSDVVWGILEDNNGCLWISTSLGLSKFDPEKKKFKTYGFTEGFQSDIFNRGAYFKDKEGIMYFGGNNGLNIFDPAEIKDHPVKPYVYITAMYLFNKEIGIGEVINGDTIISRSINHTGSVKLNYKNNVLGIEFSALHFLSPQKNRYSYIMEGYDKEWTQTNASSRIANYMNLPAGTYLFKVKASNADDVWSESPAILTITVLPPFWNTWWFRIAAMLFIAGLIFVYVNYRIHEVERQNKALEFLVTERTNEIVQQKEQLASQADNLQEINYLLKDNQEKIMAQSEELQGTNKALTQANATKDTLFSIIAHDLKNPFQVILSTSQKLFSQFDGLNDLKKREYSEAINKSSNDIYLLLQNLLEWSRSQMNKIKYQPETIELYRFAEEIIEVMLIQANSKKITINNNFQRSITVYADRNMLSTVLRNLVSNAVKFNNIGGSVTLSAYPVESDYELIISDTGIGISQEMIGKLFNMETYFTTSGTSGEQGTGLGLIICKEFIERNKGSIRVESNPGMGTSFIIRLPASTSVAAGQAAPEKETKPETGVSSLIPETAFTGLGEIKNTSGKIILLVEDNPVIRQNIKEYLSEYFNVLEAENGKEGYLMAVESIPDLIISDVMMPELDGIGLCEKLKSDERTNHIPVILLTASDSETQRISGLEKGADDYILKPFNADVLRLRLVNLIRIREELKRKYSQGIISDVHSKELTTDEHFLKKVTEIIEKNIANSDFSVEDLSGEMAMSYIQFYRKVESLTGQAPGEIMRIIRLNKAADILLRNDGNVSQTAYETGFKDPSYFAKSFRKQFGMSPTDYLKAKNTM